MMNAKMFEEAYGRAPAVIARAPGRLEILGNHTDYNEGFVLSAATEQATFVAMSPKTGSICTLKDTALPGETFTIDLDDMATPVRGDWTNYIKGALVDLQRRGKKFGAFDLLLSSTVPLSAGMSSSAALEMSFCYALKTVYGIELEKADWARVGQAVENRYMGLQSGLLDQFSSLFGKKDSLILCDFRKVEVLKNVTMPEGYCFVVGNTMVKHNLVESDYNKRRESCERACAAIQKNENGIKTLRDVSSEMLERCCNCMDEVDYRRAKHVVQEDERVMECVNVLEKGDVKAFGELLFASHESSRKNFENSCPELDVLVDLAKSNPKCLGARLSGGGFGGITIHLVRSGDAKEYQEWLAGAYQKKTGRVIKTILCSIGDGASVL